MDANIFDKLNFQPAFRIKATGVYDYADFEAQHDRSFIRALYLGILRREPDEDGEAHYLPLLRSGFSKARLVDTFLRSEESQKHVTIINGLKTQLWWIRACDFPLLGRFISAIIFLLSINEHMRDLRVLENHVIRVAEELQSAHEANLRRLQSLLK